MEMLKTSHGFVINTQRICARDNSEYEQHVNCLEDVKREHPRLFAFNE